MPNLRRFLVRVGRLELPASCSQSKRATNCATPGYSVFYPAGRIPPKQVHAQTALYPNYDGSRQKASEYFFQ